MSGWHLQHLPEEGRGVVRDRRKRLLIGGCEAAETLRFTASARPIGQGSKTGVRGWPCASVATTSALNADPPICFGPIDRNRMESFGQVIPLQPRKIVRERYEGGENRGRENLG